MILSLYPRFQEWSARGSVYLIGDTHFNDAELRAGIPTRPTDEELIKNINNHVGKNDTLVILGDIGEPAFAQLLHGYKVLIAGNHDQSLTALAPYFNEIYSGPLFIGEKILLSHEHIDVPFAYNFHGHTHAAINEPAHLINCCADAINYVPLSLGQFIKQKGLSLIPSIHRATIDKATARKEKNHVFL